MATSARNQLKQSNFLISDKAEQFSFFEHSYKSYKPFSRFTKSIPFDSTFDFGKEVKINLSKSANYADLITNLTIKVEVPDISSQNFGYTNGFAHALFESIELKIDGILIDKHSSEWMDVWSELTIKPGLQKNYEYLVKKFSVSKHTNFQSGTSYLPLHFWFCQNSSSNNTKNNMILPLVSLYSSDVELIFKIRNQNDLVIDANKTGASLTTTSTIIDASLLVDFIILDETSIKELRNKDVNKYYLITQVQEFERNISANTTSANLSFNELKYNVSELIWILSSNSDRDKNLYFKYSISKTENSIQRSVDPIETTEIKFDGNTRIEKLPSEYFQSVEPLAVHDNTPFSFIHCYSFALSPEDFSQPSGVCNFSEIHNTQLNFTFKSGLGASMLKLYAINYNVLRIRNGQGTLLNSLSKSTRKSMPTDSDLQGKPSAKSKKEESKKSSKGKSKISEEDLLCY